MHAVQVCWTVDTVEHVVHDAAEHAHGQLIEQHAAGMVP